MQDYNSTHKQNFEHAKTQKRLPLVIKLFIGFVLTLFFIATILLVSLFYFNNNLENIILENNPDIITDLNTYLDSQMDNNPNSVKYFLNSQPCPEIRTYLSNNTYNTAWEGFSQTILQTQYPTIVETLEQGNTYIFYGTFEKMARQKSIFILNNTLYILTTDRHIVSDIDQALAQAITSCYLGPERTSKEYNIQILNQKDFQNMVYKHEQNSQKQEDTYIQENLDYIKYAKEQIAYLEDIEKIYGNEYWIDKQKKDWEQNIKKAEQNIQKAEQNSGNPQYATEYVEKLKGLSVYQEDIYINIDNIEDTNCLLFTLTHETLHKLSSRKDYQLPPIWEEGLTDILAKQMLDQTIINRQFCSGYNKIDTIEELLFKNVSKQDLIDIYFSKDINKIRQVIDKQFGEGTFDKIAPELQRIHDESWKGIATEQDVKDVIKKFGLDQL